MSENILNVTLLEPKQKHPTVFARFDALPEGESLTIHCDHDPKPLYYHLLGERGNVFSWEYREQGPVWWKVLISKTTLAAREETLGRLAAKDLRKAEIFKRYGLDFCCGGKKTLREACLDKGLEVSKIEQELQQVEKNFNSRAEDYNDWSLDFLTDYIVNTHHRYVRKSLPEIKGYASKVAKVHGSQHPELSAIDRLVDKIALELSDHLDKEEHVLFPFIKELVRSEQTGECSCSVFGSVRNPIMVMETEHEMAGKDLEKIRTLSNNYALPEDACASYNLLFRMLQEFENDLHMHVHLENNILFPKALALEKMKNGL